MSTYSGSSSASLSVPLHHVPQVNTASLQTLMRPSYLYSQHPHHYHHHQQQQQPAHQLTRPSPATNGHGNPATQRFGVEGLGSGPAGTPSGLIDLSCSAPRFQHHYQRLPASAGDVSGKGYHRPRGGKCPTPMCSTTTDDINDLRLMIPASPTNTAPQVVSISIH